jgi:phosphatidylserine/phosphatidylglycerophosphate/cardiolipin synthase-like enzyme
MRLLKAGVTVARTDDDLTRYHGKMMIIDGEELYLMSFNLTHLDIERSRSFALITDDGPTVKEALQLFEADSRRQAYAPGIDSFVVSPVNARQALAAFIRDAKSELIVYDPAVTDPAMCRLLEARAKAGVKIRIIGKVSRRVNGVESMRPPLRLHTRTIVRDGVDAFIGSQSLRTAELDARREVGLIFTKPKIAARLIEVFEEDWKEAGKGAEQSVEAPAPPAAKVAKRVAKSVAAALPPVAPVFEVVVQELSGSDGAVDVDKEELEAAVRDAVKSAIKEVVADVVEQATGAPE